MFIHLGADMVIRANKIIAILDHQSKDLSQDNLDFIDYQIKNKKTVAITDDDNPKSIVVTDKEVYLSPISSQTLKRRAETVTILDEEEMM
ncbi:extracellular matrix regulator RemB [Evansella cellulosilytica]|uniref:DUF370 domain-containing protein n=1 Tax=Evansella cellulosilytica (strain ATCC 21833 / DSM 2522 / FERM P-1141 / JCM 9156 / N-4) TaxID=649639 RepID=E6TRK3_EVAC2|nr:DUF370 domain-containing protein [Evansella cellulosilytica]ADU28297.1 hypothetical protein Bcell_0005 [Evansella cellulosilytica DSM 2522]